jgi:4-hydroxy-3-methylbut-2-enyl diphosphate reductase
MNIVDATCPLVRDIHNEIKELENDGRKIIIIGDHGHDEVVGIASQVKNPLIVATSEEAMRLRKTKRAGIVSQSTQTIENVQEIVNILMSKVVDLRFVNTICFPTKRNQEQIKELSEKCDTMIVIGSFTSANSKRLTDLSKERNAKSYQVTCAEDINESWLDNCDIVGISAGASTPDNIINEVLEKIKEIGNVQKEEIYA